MGYPASDTKSMYDANNNCHLQIQMRSVMFSWMKDSERQAKDPEGLQPHLFRLYLVVVPWIIIFRMKTANENYSQLKKWTFLWVLLKVFCNGAYKFPPPNQIRLYLYFLNHETPLLIYLPSAPCIHYSVNLCIKEWPGKLSQISCRRQRHISHICSGFKNKNLCATFAVATAVAGSHRKRAAKKMTSKYEIKLAFVSVLLKTFKLNMRKMPKSMRVK